MMRGPQLQVVPCQVRCLFPTLLSLLLILPTLRQQQPRRRCKNPPGPVEQQGKQLPGHPQAIIQGLGGRAGPLLGADGSSIQQPLGGGLPGQFPVTMTSATNAATTGTQQRPGRGQLHNELGKLQQPMNASQQPQLQQNIQRRIYFSKIEP